jgi:hypothetical protein
LRRRLPEMPRMRTLMIQSLHWMTDRMPLA